MDYLSNATKPTKSEQKLAMESHCALAEVLKSLKTDNPTIEIAETNEKIKVPASALKLLAKILEVTGRGLPISIVPIALEMTTQAGADLLGCSRPHFVKLLEEGKIDFTKVGKHRRVKYEDVMVYKRKMKAKQKKLLVEIMHSDEDLGLYDT